MTVEANKALINRYFETVAGVQTGTEIGDFFAEDVVWHVPKSSPDIVPNPRVGHAAAMDLLANGVTIYQPDSLQIQLQTLIADEESVVAQLNLEAKLANGKDYKNDYMMLFTIEDGKINGVWEYLDSLYQWQLGAFEGRDKKSF